jgi:hypothetical protein
VGCAAGALVVALVAKAPCGSTPSGGFAPSATVGPLTQAVCVTFMGSVPDGWNASNVSGCSVTVTGGGATQMITGTAAQGNQPAMPAGTDGFVYWNFTAGCMNYGSVQCF